MTDHPYEHAWRKHCVSPSAVADLLAGPEGEEVRLNVKRGGGWLAQRDERWAEKIVRAVDVEEFDLGSCSRCAVGTVLGDYDAHFTGASVAEHERKSQEAISLGFLVDSAVDDDVLWAATEQAWVDYAYEQVDR